MRYLVVLLLVSACGNLQPAEPGSKLNSKTTTNTTGANNGSTIAANNTTTVQVDVGEWGTAGPASKTPKSAGGHAICALDDVRTDDLGMVNDAEVPPDPWSSTVVADDRGHCGDDLETLGWRLYNCERIGAGLQPLQCDRRLVWMSREHTLDMIAQDYFRHDNPAGELPQDRADRHQIGWSAIAENIATDADVLSLHYAWMDSQGHRENILGPYTHVGLGVEPNGRGLLATAVFLTPR